MRRFSACLLGFFALAIVVVACSHFQPAAHPLYPGATLPTEQVARLTGPVARVDGADVSRLDGAFALLPGCHVVELRRKIGEGTVSGAWSADIPPTTYAFRMRAGRSYEILVHLQSGNQGVGSANVGSVRVEAVERDSEGRTVANLRPVRKPADLEACQAWDEERTKSEAGANAEGHVDAGSAVDGGAGAG